ncbi:MFS transporter [Thermoactinomyces sp. DSM 45891]|uniref:MFS transporter n=1 Tax=Thermoactinomyces sp. DSM 45891 TaxID=1761907 RepID=UPI00336BCFFE
MRSWALYDWANSAFATTIIAAVMPTFFSDTAAKGLDPGTATAYWGYTDSIASLFVLLLSPILGAIADASGSKKIFLRFFTYIGAISCLLMFTIGAGNWIWASLLICIGTIAFSGANVFYDAFLTDIAPPEKRDYVSSVGYSYGYIGGGILLAAQLYFILNAEIFGVTPTTATQISLASVGVWWFLFAIPLFRNVPEKKMVAEKRSAWQWTRIGFRDVRHTLSKITKYPELIKFLIAFWFFNDGINTIIKMATIYGKEIGIGTTHLITALLLTQFIGFPSTLLFGKIAEKVGSKSTLFITLFTYLILVCIGYYMQSAMHFYILAGLVGLVQGGSQAISRSIFSRMVPVYHNTEFFGFFSLTGKCASILGPFVFALVGQLSGSSRLGILSLVFFFVVGIILLFRVNIPKGEKEALNDEAPLINM